MNKFILKRKLKKIYKKKLREKHFLNWKDIHTILVLFDTAHFDEATIFIDQLKKSGKKVSVYASQKKGDLRDYSNTNYRVLSEKEVSKWLNNPLHTIVKEMQKETFDLAIDLTLIRNLPLEYILANASVSITTGLKKIDFPQYDLAITTLFTGEAESYQIRELGKQIVFYLDKIDTR